MFIESCFSSIGTGTDAAARCLYVKMFQLVFLIPIVNWLTLYEMRESCVSWFLLFIMMREIWFLEKVLFVKVFSGIPYQIRLRRMVRMIKNVILYEWYLTHNWPDYGNIWLDACRTAGYLLSAFCVYMHLSGGHSHVPFVA